MKQMERWSKDMGDRISKKLRSERSAATLAKCRKIIVVKALYIAKVSI
jgi:hypothetical protein